MGKHDAVIVKFDKDGKLLWQTSWGGNNYDHINHLFQTSDGSFIAHGYSYSTDIEGLPNKGEHDAIVLKFDKDGKLLWQTSWGGNKFDHFENILQTQDDSVIVHGYSYSTNIDGFSNKGAHDVVIVKYDNEGNMYIARQITIDEFALISAVSIGDSLYNDIYSSVSESNIGYTRTFTFSKIGPNYHNITGELSGFCHASTQKPKLYGAKAKKGFLDTYWGAASGSETKTSTLTFTENTGIGMYSGTVVIEDLNASSGTYRVTYNGQTKECYTTTIGGLFKY